MAIISPLLDFPALSVRGKIGIGRGYGASEYGRMRYGFSEGFLGVSFYGDSRYGSAVYGSRAGQSGIYQRRLVGVGVFTKSKKTAGRWGLSRSKFYAPTETSARLANPMRGVFADAVSTWQGLTTDQKAAYSKQGSKRRMPGYQYFISSYMQSHRT